MKFKVMRIKDGKEETLSIYTDKEKAESKLKLMKSMVREGALRVNEFYIEEVSY